jgi:putative transcriptional regulator
MDELDFDSLMQGIEAMTAQLRGEGANMANVADPDVLAIREATDLNQIEFAALLGVSRRTVDNWEQRRTRPIGPADALLRLFKHDPRAAVKILQR